MYLSWVAQFTPRVAQDVQEEAPRQKYRGHFRAACTAWLAAWFPAGAALRAAPPLLTAGGKLEKASEALGAIEFVPCVCPPQTNPAMPTLAGQRP